MVALRNLSERAAPLRNVRFAYGTAVLGREVRNDAELMSLIRLRCSMVVPAGPLHWRYLHRAPVTMSADSIASLPFDFSEADGCFSFAETHHLLVRGHTLVWHEMLPSWMPPNLDRSTATSLLTEHISAVVGRYRGRVHSWDVVNEIVQPADRRADGMRNTLWLRSCGPDYPLLAFATARDADPKALLGFNEYGLESDSANADAKRWAVLRLLQKWRRQGVQVDYLGLQAHLLTQDQFSKAKLGEFLLRISDLGLKIFVTELDVNDKSEVAAIEVRDVRVADTYARFLDIALGSAEIPVVVTWGLSDRSSWLQTVAPREDGQPQRPLPFDSVLRPKPAWRVIEALMT